MKKLSVMTTTIILLMLFTSCEPKSSLADIKRNGRTEKSATEQEQVVATPTVESAGHQCFCATDGCGTEEQAFEAYLRLSEIEARCQAMMTGYEVNKHIYLTYAESEDKEEALRAQQARDQANLVAESYNSYFAENQYVWNGSVSSYICNKLAPLE